MKFNSKYRRLLLLFSAVFSLAFLPQAWGNEEKMAQNIGVSNLSEAKDKDLSATNDHRIIVYYFHGSYRCRTCKQIERLTKEAVFGFFDDELNKGLIEFKVINIEEPNNKHFVKNYRLFTKSVVVSDIVKGKENQWKILQKVWELVYNEEAFKGYVRNEIKAYLFKR
jgi:hypothetical protein